MYWPEQKMLIVADLHLGKIDHLRKHGSALPDLSNAVDYIHLEQNIAEFKPEKLIFLGDLFHSTLNKSWFIFEQWAQRQPVDFTLVVGNHDIIPVKRFEDLGFSIEYYLDIAGFSLTHIPEENENLFNLSGHIHPGFKLRGKGRQQIKLSCFYQKANQMILPAYGSFTGNYYIKPEKDEHVYVLTEDSVLKVY
jgi:DNA ligase-associated metallophosphoesterase